MYICSSRSYEICCCAFPSTFPWGINYYFTFYLKDVSRQNHGRHPSNSHIPRERWSSILLVSTNLYWSFDSPAKWYGSLKEVEAVLVTKYDGFLFFNLFFIYLNMPHILRIALKIIIIIRLIMFMLWNTHF